MSNQMPTDDRTTTDQILDLLLDALVERQRERRARTQVTQTPARAPSQAAGPETPRQATSEPLPPPRPEPSRADQYRAASRPDSAKTPPSNRPTLAPEPGEEGWEPPAKLPSIQMGKTLGRLLLLVLILIVAVNVPVTRYGVSLARILPETTSLIIRDGLVLKGSGSEIYILEQDKLRWISSMDAFEHLNLTWGDVHIVEDEFLTRFEKGTPIHVLLKCQASPHIYRLENGEKRWIKDIETFEAEKHSWNDVRFVSCDYLRDLPDGPPIPEDAGPPPQP